MEFTEYDEYERYRRYLLETDPEELLMIAVERYQAEVLGVDRLMTGGDIVSILNSMASEEDLMMKNKGGWVQIYFMGKPKAKEKVILDCEAARRGAEQPKLWQRKIIQENQKRTGEFYGDAG